MSATIAVDLPCSISECEKRDIHRRDHTSETRKHLSGVETKPGVIEGRIEPCEYLCVTVSFDHNIVDGVPAARYVSRLRELVEAAAILPQDSKRDAAA